MVTHLVTSTHLINHQIKLDGYEMSNGIITGYKVYKLNEQIGTLEFREGEWIVGVLIGYKVKVQVFSHFQQAYEWILMNIDE